MSPLPLPPAFEESLQGRKQREGIPVIVGVHLETSEVADADNSRSVALADAEVVNHDRILLRHQFLGEGRGTPVDTLLPGEGLLVEAKQISKAEGGPAQILPATNALCINRLVPAGILLTEPLLDCCFLPVGSVCFLEEGIDVLVGQRPGIAIVLGHGVENSSHDFVFKTTKTHIFTPIVEEACS